MRWWRLLGLRWRLILIGLAGLTVGLVAGGLVLVATLQVALQRTVDDGALQTARTVRDLVDADRLPDPIPAVGAPTAVIQVVDARGRVRAASASSDRLVSLLRPDELRAARDGQRLFLDGGRAGVNGVLRVVAVAAGPRGDPLTVVVAAPTGQVASSVRILRFALLVGFPVLLALLAVLAWRVIGLTLRPVEALRRGAEEITGAGAPGALPVPEARDEVRLLAVTLNDMLARLDAARRRQRAFVADAAHELRSPLANMRTQLEVAQRLGDATDWPATAADLLIDTERLSRLVDDLLLLARADWADTGRAAAVGAAAEADSAAEVESAAGAVDSAAGAVDSAAGARAAAGGSARQGLVELVQLVTEVAARYTDARVVPTVSGAEPVWVEGEPDALRRIVTNLLDNAVRHASGGVVLEARPGDGGREAVLTVTDDGTGIAAADRERVFDRFTRLDDARSRDAGGAGLGLAIVRELTRLHGGTVALYDAAPGVRAEVHLPARPTPP